MSNDAIDACRKNLANLDTKGHPNASLFLHRYLKKLDDPVSVASHYKDLQGFSAPEPYRQAFERWKKLLGGRDEILQLEYETITPLAIGLGNESPTEVGLTLHFTYGMPIIPGAAIKGLCRRAAIAANLIPAKAPPQSKNALLQTLFGDQDMCGAFVFYDAWYSPPIGNDKPFHRDVVTVHHPNYYQKNGESYPTDFDDPKPIPFLVIKPKTRFLFCVAMPSPEWSVLIKSMLSWALDNLGIGAKTNTGYGRLRLLPEFSSGASEPSGSPQKETLKNVPITFDPSRSQIKARVDDKWIPPKSGQEQRLLQQLSEQDRKELKERKKAYATVDVQTLGNQKILAAIRDIRFNEGR